MGILIKFLSKFIIKNRLFITIALIYFVVRLINLTKLPIFNDEAIYLDWGFRELTRPGYLYYSLYDAKQPLLMWIFGSFEMIFSDPLFSGRIVSVIMGFLTLLGIYKLAKLLLNENTGLLSSIIYIFVPIFSFYDRQALMESAIATVGVWTCYILINAFINKSLKDYILLGLVLGLGFFIKSSALIFFASYIILSVVYFLFSKKKMNFLKMFLWSIVLFIASSSLLLLNPLFWSTFESNSRYALTFNQLLSFPLSHWINNLSGNLNIAFFYVTPLIFMAAVLGILFILFKKENSRILFLLFFLVSFFLVSILVRYPSDRYLFPFLPLFSILCSFAVLQVFSKGGILQIFVFLAILSFPVTLTVTQVLNPPEYILFMSNLTEFNNINYLKGVTSGYGINEAVKYFNLQAENKKIVIGIGENTGNPESAILDYFYKSKNIRVAYLDSRLLPPNFTTIYSCVSSDVPLYFVARDQQLVGLDKYLQKIKTVKNVYGGNSIGIYSLKTNCKGKNFKLTLQKPTT